MLKDQIIQYITEQEANRSGEEETAVFKEEKEYAQRHQLAGSSRLVEKDAHLRFSDAYIERCDKLTENLLRNESSQFLMQPLVYLYKHKNEFIYLESSWFDVVRTDAVSIEFDDVFGTYDVMLGLKLPKKLDKKIREFLDSRLHGEEAKFDLLFSQEEGLWNLNFALNYIDGFDENMTIGEGCQLIYRFLFQLIETIEPGE